MPTITILCPYHAAEEHITLPDSYQGIGYDSTMTFEGHVPCNPDLEKKPMDRYGILEIKVHLDDGSQWVERLKTIQNRAQV